MRTFFLFTFLVLIFLGRSLEAFKQEIKPSHVIVRSSYRERIAPPEVNDHAYDLRLKEDNYEPYPPNFRTLDYDLPEDFPENKEISWLAKAMPKVSEFFLREEGILENAILLYRQKRLNKAEKKLNLILSSKSAATRESAKLWLGWTKFKQNRPLESLSLMEELRETKSRDTLREACYLSSLILIKQSEFQRHLSLMKSLEEKLPAKNRGFRLSYCYLISLIQTRDWPAAEKLLKTIEKGKFYHAKLYYKIKEAAGVVYYALNNYKKSLENYLLAAKLTSDFKRRKSFERNIAWLYYLTKQFDRALKVVGRLEQGRNRADMELSYLKLACLTEFQKWTAAQNILKRISPQSDFYFYSIVKLRLSLSAEGKTNKSLKEAILSSKRHFPREKFYVYLLDGVDYFRRGQYDKAEEECLKAASLNVGPAKLWMARYNLGLTRLKQKKFRAAEKDFLWLTNEGAEKKMKPLSYHLLYAYYQLKETKKFLALEKRASLEFPEKISEEIQLMKAGSLLAGRNPRPAVEEFMKIWEKNRDAPTLEFIVKGRYKMKQFQTVVDLIRRNPEVSSETLLIYEAKSLLALQKFPEALKRIEGKILGDERGIKLRLEVLQANRLYRGIIKLISALLNRELGSEQRLLYYLSLGDAYYNLKQYSESKNQFYKALALVEDPWQKSLILYNIALSAYYSGDYASFLKEANITINNRKLNSETKYNLTQLLVKYHLRNNQPEKADSTLEEYIQANDYQRAKVNIKRIHLLYKEKRFKLCFELAAKELKGESARNRRDRIVMAGYCGSSTVESRKAVNLLETELENKTESYRRPELVFVLIRNHHDLGEYQKALRLGREMKNDKISGRIAMRLKLILTAVYLKLNRLEEAEKELGDIERHRLANQYSDALFLTVEIQKAKNKTEKAMRTALRIYYLPDISEEAKQKALLRLAELRVKQNLPKEAKKYLDKINEELIMTDIYLRSDYLNLRNELK